MQTDILPGRGKALGGARIWRWERKLGKSVSENEGRLEIKIGNKYINPQSNNAYTQIHNCKCTKDTDRTQLNAQIHNTLMHA